MLDRSPYMEEVSTRPHKDKSADDDWKFRRNKSILLGNFPDRYDWDNTLPGQPTVWIQGRHPALLALLRNEMRIDLSTEVSIWNYCAAKESKSLLDARELITCLKTFIFLLVNDAHLFPGQLCEEYNKKMANSS